MIEPRPFQPLQALGKLEEEQEQLELRRRWYEMAAERAKALRAAQDSRGAFSKTEEDLRQRDAANETVNEAAALVRVAEARVLRLQLELGTRANKTR